MIISAKRQRRDWKAVYLEYCESGLSVEQFGRTIAVSGSWITENFRQLSRAGEIAYTLPKESLVQKPAFMPLTLNDASAADPAESSDKSVLKVTIGKAVIEIPAGLCIQNPAKQIHPGFSRKKSPESQKLNSMNNRKYLETVISFFAVRVARQPVIFHQYSESPANQIPPAARLLFLNILYFQITPAQPVTAL